MSHMSLIPAGVNEQSRYPQPECTLRDAEMQAEAPPHRLRAGGSCPLRTRRVRGECVGVGGLMDPMQPGPSNTQSALTSTFAQDLPSCQIKVDLGRDEDRVDPRRRALSLTSFLRPEFWTDERRWHPVKAIVAVGEIIGRGLAEISSLAVKLASEPLHLLDDDHNPGLELQSYERKPSSDPEQVNAGQQRPQSMGSRHPFWPQRWRDSTGEFGWDAERVMFVKDGIVEPTAGPIW